MRILVTGATGYVGSRLVTALLDAGHDVVATTRKPDRLADFGWHAAHRAACPASARRRAGPVAAALRIGIDIVINLVPKATPA